MDRVHPHRRLIVLAIAAIAIVGCGESRKVDVQEDVSAPTVGRGPRADPPPGISPPSSGGSSGDFAPGPGCPSKRTVGESSPVDPLTADDVLGATGIYRPCLEPNGLEIRWDEAAGKLHWYRLDDRFVRIQQWEGTIDVGSCDGSTCAVEWTDRGLPSRTYVLELWRDPIALRLTASGAADQEWVRIAE